MPAARPRPPPTIAAGVQPTPVPRPRPAITPAASNRNGQTNTSIRRNLGSLRASRAISSSSMRALILCRAAQRSRVFRLLRPSSAAIGGLGRWLGCGGVGRGGSTGAAGVSDGGRCDGFRKVRREPAAALENEFRRLLLQVEIVERGVPVGVGPAPPLDSFFPRAFEKRQRLPAGFFLGLLGPALVFLELLVDLLLGLGILVLASLGVALKRLAHLVASPGILRFQRLAVDLVLGGELRAAALYSVSSRSIRLRKPSSVSDSRLARSAISASRSVSATASF